MRVFDDVLEALSDGEYHVFEEIKFKAARNFNEAQVESALKFLEQYDLIARKRNRWGTHGAKLTQETFNFLKGLKELEDIEKAEYETRIGIAKEEGNI